MGQSPTKSKKASKKTGSGGGNELSSRDASGAGTERKTFVFGPRDAAFSLAASVSLLTFLVYLKALQNGFVNWDDPLYVLENPYIRSLNPAFFKWAFFDFYAANWHPLAWISHALDYAVWGLNPLGHHLTNNILHAVNTFLVTILAARLLEAGPSGFNSFNSLNGLTKGPLIAAGTTGLLFGLHPVHVESVAWVTERKDLLCALFFLLAVMAYMNAVKRMEHGAERKFLTPGALRSALCFFVLALFSKPMAVTLPAVLLILDRYPYRRMQSLKSFGMLCVEKLPFIALSLVSAILTMKAQKAGAAMGLMDIIPLSSRVLVAAQSLVLYLWNMVAPITLIPFYPHPKDASLFSAAYSSAVILVIGITAACLFMVNKRGFLLPIWGYYVVTLLPVLGLVQVGGQSMADRYAYLPSMGPFLLFGLGTAWMVNKARAVGKRGPAANLPAAGAVFVILSLSFLTYQQIQIWEDSVALWTHAIEKEPGKASVAYKNRGVYFQESGQFDRAIEDYNKAIDLDPRYVHAYNNRGLAFEKTGRLEKAFEDYNKAITLQPDNGAAYINRGLAFDKAGQLERAVADYTKAISLNPSDHNVYNYRGISYDRMGLLDKAIADYDRAVEVHPDFHEAYKNRGAAFNKMGRFDKAITDFDKAISLNPSDYTIYIATGVSYGQRGVFDKALDCFNRAIAVNPNDPEAYNNRGFTYLLAGQYDRALQDFNKTIGLNHTHGLAYNNRGNLYLKTGRNDLAVSDFQKACALGDRQGCDFLKRYGK